MDVLQLKSATKKKKEKKEAYFNAKYGNKNSTLLRKL